MSTKTVAQLFHDKQAKYAAELGKALGPVEFDNKNNRHVQRFENGVILGHLNKLKIKKELICVHGKLFHAWWEKSDAAWLGEPLEDIFKTTNAEGYEILVQRFKKGVINCRADGVNDVQWLSWHDWRAISKPGAKGDTAP